MASTFPRYTSAPLSTASNSSDALNHCHQSQGHQHQRKRVFYQNRPNRTNNQNLIRSRNSNRHVDLNRNQNSINLQQNQNHQRNQQQQQSLPQPQLSQSSRHLPITFRFSLIRPCPQYPTGAVVYLPSEIQVNKKSLSYKVFLPKTRNFAKTQF